MTLLRDTQRSQRSALLVWLGLVAILLLIYASSIGRGFVKDDVVWVGANQVTSLADARELLFRSNGFYRPVVSASFAVDRAIHGLEPFGFGVTNFSLLLLAGFALTRVARGLGLSGTTGVVVAAVWALNFHGVNMAVLWLSGRTALWLAIWSLLAAAALIKRRPFLAGGAAALAMFSKEEAVMLPLILSAWAYVLDVAHTGDSAARVKRAARLVWPTWAAVAVYLLMRAQTDAMTPIDSTVDYRFTSDPLVVLRSLGEYIDRACTFPALVLIIACLMSGRRPQLSPQTRRMALLGLIWFCGMYALTILLPARSSLYALAPSVAPALLAGAFLQDLWAASPLTARRRMTIAAASIPVLLLPVYWQRNVRWTEIADLSTDTFAVLREMSATRPAVTHVVFHDDPTTRRSFANTYGPLLPEAVRLAAGRDLRVTMVRETGDEESYPQATDGARADIVLARGHVSTID